MKKKLLLIIASSMLIFSLTGCFPDGKKTLSKDGLISNLISIPEELQKTLDENLIIDADIVVPETFPARTYQATLKEEDKEKIEEVFLSNKEITNVEEFSNDFDKTKKNYLYSTTDDASLFIEGGSLFFYEKKAIERQYTRYVKGDSSFIDYNLKETFPKETLNNVDREASVQSFKDICDGLEVEISGEPEVYALDAENLDRITDYSEEQPNGEPIEKWTEEDQVYFITAHVLYDAFPMTQFGYITKSGYGKGTCLSAIFGVDGLIEFSLNPFYEIIDNGKDISKICSLDVANNAIKEKYKNTILSNPVTVSEIRLEYVPVQKDVEKQIYELTPMWVYTASQDSQNTKGQQAADDNQMTRKEAEKVIETTNTFQIYVNALTGAEFDIGGTL